MGEYLRDTEDQEGPGLSPLSLSAHPLPFSASLLVPHPCLRPALLMGLAVQPQVLATPAQLPRWPSPLPPPALDPPATVGPELAQLPARALPCCRTGSASRAGASASSGAPGQREPSTQGSRSPGKRWAAGLLQDPPLPSVTPQPPHSCSQAWEPEGPQPLVAQLPGGGSCGSVVPGWPGARCSPEPTARMWPHCIPSQTVAPALLRGQA